MDFSWDEFSRSLFDSDLLMDQEDSEEEAPREPVKGVKPRPTPSIRSLLRGFHVQDGKSISAARENKGAG